MRFTSTHQIGLPKESLAACTRTVEESSRVSYGIL
jgi:hypothetical protein